MCVWQHERMRVDRLAAALLLMQARGRVTAAEVAAELQVSMAIARRDLEALSAAGLPVSARRGRRGGWALMADWADLPLILQTRQTRQARPGGIDLAPTDLARLGAELSQLIMRPATAGDGDGDGGPPLRVIGHTLDRERELHTEIERELHTEIDRPQRPPAVAATEDDDITPSRTATDGAARRHRKVGRWNRGLALLITRAVDILDEQVSTVVGYRGFS
jgi:HTH domain